LNSSEAEEDARVGFEEVAEQAEGQVGDHEELEGVAGVRSRFAAWVGVLRLRRDFAALRHGSAQDDISCVSIFNRNSFQDAGEDRDEKQEENNFVELGGMARDAIAEVDGPGEIRGSAVGVVGEAGEEAADAADGDSECEGDGVEVSGGLTESDVAFRQLDGEEAESQCADDGFASCEVRRIVQVVPCELRVFEPEQKPGADGGSGHGGGDCGPPQRGGDRVFETAAKSEVDAEGGYVS